MPALFLINSTFSGNKAKGGRGGDGGSLGNTADSRWRYSSDGSDPVMGDAIRGEGGAGAANYRPGALPSGMALVINRSDPIALKNTLIGEDSPGRSCEAEIESMGYNIDSDGSCALAAEGDRSGIPIKLMPLKNNGGATPTHAVPPDSSAIDGGNPAGCTDHKEIAILTDQRGQSRSWGGRCNVGAFEYSR